MSLNTTPATWTAATVPTAATFNTEVRDAFVGIQAAWESYTPAISGWTLSNGTVTGKFIRVGKTVHARGRYTVGSSDTKAGELLVSLPVAARATYTDPWPLGACSMTDVSASASHQWSVIARSTTTIAARGSAGKITSATAPFTWATGDLFFWTVTYEAA
jgi:hypothetical protein